jgi:predicted MFS family arabinose efflux permease
VQREIGEGIRSSAFAVSETVNQVANVAGALAGVLVSMLDNGQIGLAIAAAGLTAALVALIGQRRRRILAQNRADGARARARGARGGGQPPP